VSTDDRQPSASGRPKRKTAAERAEEFDAEQRRLKEEAQERREAAARRTEDERAGDKPG
jgi:hypothetical protein